jgi:hypothetical protein
VLFADTVEELVVAVGHEEVHSNEVVNGSEAAGREVALRFGLVRCVNWVFALGNFAIGDLPCTGQAHSPPMGAYPEAL